MGTFTIPKKARLPRVRQRRGFARRWLVSAASIIALAQASCSNPNPLAPGGAAEGFVGVIAADEPNAVVVGNNILMNGGTAADAAVAMYFTLAVTLPSTAGLGGGGACLVHGAKSKMVEALEFPSLAGPDGRIGLPGNVRGMAALHARYGKLRWAQLVSLAEKIARDGIAVPRAFARDVQAGTGRIAADPALSRLFAPGGTPVVEGQNLQQVELAATLGQIRAAGGGDFYVGTLAEQIRAAAQSIGVNLPDQTLRKVVPVFVPTLEVDAADLTLHVAPPPADGGVVSGQMAGILSNQGYGSANGTQRTVLIADAAMRAFAYRAGWMQGDGSSAADPAALLAGGTLDQIAGNGGQPSPAATGANSGQPLNPWAAGLVVADNQGGAVACEFTLNDLFGSGRVLPGTGIVLAAAPPASGEGTFAIGPIMASNSRATAIYFAAAGGGGNAAAPARSQVLLDTLDRGWPLLDALAARRAYRSADGILWAESGIDPAAISELGGNPRQVPELGHVNAFVCDKGIPARPDTCTVASDPRGAGFAIVGTE